MDELLRPLLAALPLLGLYLLRVGAMLMLLPVFGDRSPRLVRAGLTVILSLSIFLASERVTAPPLGGAFLLQAAGEVAVGLLMGFIIRVCFTAMRLAGEILSVEIGYGFAGVIDPLSGHPTPSLATLYDITAALLFLSSDAHLYLLQGVAASFNRIPPGEVSLLWLQPAILKTVHLIGISFSTAITLAAPVFVVSLVFSTVAAILAKAVPGFHVMEFSFPLRIVLSLAMLWFSFPLLAPVLRRLFQVMNEAILIR